MTGLGYAELAWWFVTAVGAALTLGTGAALWTYARTGLFPGHADGVAAGALPWAVAKIVLGLALVAVGVLGLT